MHKVLYGEELVFATKKDMSADFTFLLPEYLPNISRIVTTSALVERCSVSEMSGEAVLDIGLAVSVIYISDFGGRIKNAVFRENVSLNLKDRLMEDDGITCIASAFVSSVSSKLETSRRIHTVCNLSGSIACHKESSSEMFDGNDDDKICLLRTTAELCRKTVISALPFEHEAEITIDKENSSVGEIILADAVFCSSSVNVRDEQLDFEGKFMLHILYEVSSDDSGKEASYAVINAPVTVSDTIRDDRIKEGNLGFVHFDVSSLTPSVSFDPYGENRVISFTLKYSADAHLYAGDKCEIISDAFSESFQSTPTFSDISIKKILETVSDTVQLSQPLRVDIKELSDISDCRAKILSVSMEHADGKIFAAAKCSLEILGTNMQGELCSVDSTVTLHIPVYSAETQDNDIIPDVFLSIKNCNAKIKEGELTADFDICVSGVIMSRSHTVVVTGLETDESSPRQSSKGEVIVYYPQSGDSLWSVSKKYGANPEVLKQVNALENDDITSKHIILIP